MCCAVMSEALNEDVVDEAPYIELGLAEEQFLVELFDISGADVPIISGLGSPFSDSDSESSQSISSPSTTSSEFTSFGTIAGLNPAPYHSTNTGSGSVSNGTTYYCDPPAQFPVQFQQHYYQTHLPEMGTAPTTSHVQPHTLGNPNTDLYIWPPPPQAYYYNHSPYGFPPSPAPAPQMPSPASYRYVEVPPPIYPAGRPNPYARQMQGPLPTHPIYQTGALPSYGMSFPQPIGPNLIRHPPMSPYETHFNTPLVSCPHRQPVQMQQYGVPPLVFMPQPLAPQYCGGFGPMIAPNIIPPSYESLNGYGEVPVQQDQQQFVDYYNGQPLIYYTAAENTTPVSPPPNYNTEVYYLNRYEGQAVETQDYRDVSSSGIRNSQESQNNQEPCKHVATETDAGIGAVTAQKDSRLNSDVSWSEMMDSEDNAYEEFSSSNNSDELHGISSTSSSSLDEQACSSSEKDQVVPTPNGIQMLQKPMVKGMGVLENYGAIVNSILKNMVDCGNIYVLNGEVLPYVSNYWDPKIIATVKIPQPHYSYYVPPVVEDDDFFGGQRYVWQTRMMDNFNRYCPDVWKIQALPDFQDRGTGWHNFTITSKLRFCCRNCLRPWTSMRGTIMFSFKYDAKNKSGNILMKIFGQVCVQKKCIDNNFQTPTCYSEEIERVVWKLSEVVGCIYYGIPLSPYFYVDPDKAIRIGNPGSPHRKELCQACQKGMCSKV